MKLLQSDRVNRKLAGLMTFVMLLSVMIIPVSAAASDNSVSDNITTVKDRNWRSYCSQYVFDQMDAAEKALYNNLETVCMSYAKSSSANAEYKKYSVNGNDAYGYYLSPAEYDNLDMEQVQEIIQLFIYQNPQYYFTTISMPCLYTSKEVYLPCYAEFANGEDRARATNSLFEEIDRVVSEICKAEKSTETRNYDIEKAAHDYLCEQLSYEDEDFSQSIYSVFTSKKTVCLGYSLSFELLLNAAGVTTVTTYSDMHAWNKVYVGDNWYAVDVTWDDQDWGIIEDWFNKSDESICFDDGELFEHTVKAPKYFPIASSDYITEDIEDKTDNKVIQAEVVTTPDSNNTIIESDKAEIAQDNSEAYVGAEVIEIEEDSNSDVKKEIRISGTKLSKVKAGSKKCAVTWKKVKNVEGYEIQLSTSKKFKKIAKKAKISSSKNTTTIKKLKKKTTYYVRIRTYKKVNGKTQTSSWSGVKKVTIK